MVHSCCFEIFGLRTIIIIALSLGRRSPQKNRRWRPAAELVTLERLTQQQAPVRRPGKVIPTGKMADAWLTARIHCRNPSKRVGRGQERRPSPPAFNPDGNLAGQNRLFTAIPSTLSGP